MVEHANSNHTEVNAIFRVDFTTISKPVNHEISLHVNLRMILKHIDMYICTYQHSNFIVAIMVIAAEEGKLAMYKMKLYSKCKASFGSYVYLRKAHAYFVNCPNFWLNLLYLQERFLDRVKLLISINLFVLVLKSL